MSMTVPSDPSGECAAPCVAESGNEAVERRFPQIGAGDVGELRAWLRARLAVGATAGPKPAWLDVVMPCLSPGRVRVLITQALAEIVSAQALRVQEAEAWADYARLTGQKSSQKDMARRLGVTTRTTRAWLAKGDAALASFLSVAQS
jgi:hypothetical protein